MSPFLIRAIQGGLIGMMAGVVITYTIDYFRHKQEYDELGGFFWIFKEN